MNSRSPFWQSRQFLGSWLLACAACATSPHPGSGAPDPNPKPVSIHVVAAGAQGILVNAYLVEGSSGLVLVDSALTVSDAKKLRARADALNKPLLAVLLTHGHPDHYNGVTELLRGRPEVPVYATTEVSRVIEEADAVKEAQWKPMFGDEWPTSRTFPNRRVADGTELVLDGLRWTVHAVGPGESHADSYWSLEAEQRYVFLGDVVMHGVHAYMTDGHSTNWLSNLERLRPALAGAKMLYPGHGQAGGLELLDWEKGYLEAYRAAVAKLRGTRSALSDEEKQTLTTMLKAEYPNAGLDFLIALGADAVAAELAEGQAAPAAP